MRASLRPGLSGRLDYVVPTERTVPHLFPEAEEFAGLPDVLATGYLVGILEWACIRVVAGHLEDGEATLGIHVDVSHEAPTPPGCPIAVEAHLIAVEGRRLTFRVEARDDAAVIARGTHRRAVIDTGRFADRLRARTTSTR